MWPIGKALGLIPTIEPTKQVLARMWRNGCHCTLWKMVWWFFRNFRVTEWPSTPLWGYVQKNWSRIMRRYLHTHVPGSTICNSREVKSTQMSTLRGMKKQNVQNGMFLSFRSKEVLARAATWMKLKNIVLTKISQLGMVCIYLHKYLKQSHL